MKSKFSFTFTKKRILALCEAGLALVTFFTLFVPSVVYTNVNGGKTYYNGFSYLGNGSDFSASAGGVFFLIFLIVFAGLCIAKVFVHERYYRLFNILAMISAFVALCLVVHAPTSCMLNTTKRLSSMFYFVGAWIQIGLTACLVAFPAVDEWAPFCAEAKWGR